MWHPSKRWPALRVRVYNCPHNTFDGTEVTGGSMFIKYTLLAVTFAVLAGCTSAPIRNVNDAPVVTGSGKPVTADQVRIAIVGAGRSLGWAMTPADPGLVVGRITLRGHTAVVDVRYTPKSFSIQYKDSVDLNYRDGQIHKNYNGWVENLERDIRGNLLAL